MIEVPKRPSLIERTVEVLRRHLHASEWADGLPAERVLSEQLQVSRPTLRLALQILQREGLVLLSRHPRKWIPTRTHEAGASAKSQLVQFVSCVAFNDLSPSQMIQLYQLRRHIQDAGFRLEVTADARLNGRMPGELLERMVKRTKACCWVLHQTTPFLQRWFSDRKLPSIVKGSCYEGITLPSFDFDYHAIVHHAVGHLLRLGHRRIALLVPRHHGAGEVLREQSFLRAFAELHCSDAYPTVLRHNATAGHIHSVLRHALGPRNRPTALIASESMHALNALTLVLNQGLRVPGDLSLISCDDEGFLAHVSPSLTRYRIDWSGYARRLLRMIIKLAETGDLPRRAVRVIPTFDPGASVAPVS